jgi:hypothetical protein
MNKPEKILSGKTEYNEPIPAPADFRGRRAASYNTAAPRTRES